MRQGIYDLPTGAPALDVQLSRCSIQVKYSATAVDRPARELVRTTPGSNPEGERARSLGRPRRLIAVKRDGFFQSLIGS